MVWRRLSKIRMWSASISRAQGMAVGGVSSGRRSMNAHHVIAQVAHQPAPEPGQTRGRRGREALQHPAQVLKRVHPGVQGLDGPPAVQGHLAVPALHHQGRVEPEKAVAPPFFAALHALQEIGGTLVPELLVSRYRGFEIPQDLTVHRHDVGLLRHLPKRIKIGNYHCRSINGILGEGRGCEPLPSPTPPPNPLRDWVGVGEGELFP